MRTTRRDLLNGAAAASFLTALPGVASGGNDLTSLQSLTRKTAFDLGLPGFVAGVVIDGKLAMVQAKGLADLEKRTAMTRDHICSPSCQILLWIKKWRVR